MRLLKEATARETARLDDIEHEARNLLSDLDTLEVRLHRAFTAASIDMLVRRLNMGGNQMLKREECAETGARIAGFAILGFRGLFSLFSGRKVNWDREVPAAFPEESFKDIRIAISDDDGIRLINMSKRAREQDMSIDDAVVYLQREGTEVLGWPEFEARARNMRRAVISGELVLEERRKPQGLPEGRQTKWVRASPAGTLPPESSP